MNDKTLTRMDLSEAVFRELGLSRNESADLVESVLEKICASALRASRLRFHHLVNLVFVKKAHELGVILKPDRKLPYLRAECLPLGLLI